MGGLRGRIGSGAVLQIQHQKRLGQIEQKSDPFAFASELRPKSASIVSDLQVFLAGRGWIERRSQTNWLEKPITTFEVHLGSWKRPKDGREYFSYKELAHMLVEYCQEMGYTHLQLLRSPSILRWLLGYQTTGYFAPTSRFGTPRDFMYFVDYCHQHDNAVLVDWVPAHFPSDGHGLGRSTAPAFTNTPTPDRAPTPTGGHAGLQLRSQRSPQFPAVERPVLVGRLPRRRPAGRRRRIDAVPRLLAQAGEWIPNQYGGRENLEAVAIPQGHEHDPARGVPGILTVAEESTACGEACRGPSTGGLGFSFKWDMGWMNDTLRYQHRDPVHRKFHQNELSFRMVYAFTENFILPLSHDEVVHGKQSLISQMPGDYWQRFANLRLLYGYQYTMPGKKLLFMGERSANGTSGTTTARSTGPYSVSPRRGLKRLVRD